MAEKITMDEFKKNILKVLLIYEKGKDGNYLKECLNDDYFKSDIECAYKDIHGFGLEYEAKTMADTISMCI